MRKNVVPMFMTRLMLGEFDPEYMNPYNKIDASFIQSPEHRQVAITAAMKSFVLLKNGILPLTNKLPQLTVSKA